MSDLQARAGVVTGRVMTWASPAEGLVVGDQVNTAARVQSEAAPSSVLVDETTMRLTRAAVAYRDAGGRAVKGKSEVLRLWRTERVVAGVGGVQRIEGLETAFVGRGRELSVVKELFHASAEEGRARLVLVLGAAGVGKSRLGWEFDKYVDGLATTVWWHRGRCLSYGEGVAFWALAEIIRQRLGVAESDDPDTAAGKLVEALPQWVPDERERAVLTPRLGVLVGASHVELPREELFAGWRLFLERLAEVRPVVLLIENLQWADAGLLDFLEYLLEWSHDSALFILTLARPDLIEARAGWLTGRRDAVTLSLAPLSDAVLAEVLHGLVPGLPVPVTQRIIANAQGVPLYAVELVRSLLDRGIVTATDDGYTVTGAMAEIDVPASLTSLISARLDGLPRAERGLVKDLAVLGDSFPLSSVTAISTAPAERTTGLLTALVGKEILTARADPLSPDRGQYTFVQTMLRSVAHDMLTKRERRTRHLAVAQHLETASPTGGDEVAEVIADHYLQAYHASPPDQQDDLRAATVQALTRAGRRAGLLGAPDTAEHHCRTAAELSSNEEQKTALMEFAADMAFQAGRYADAHVLYETAARAHMVADRHHAAAALAAKIGSCQTYTGNLEQAISTMRAAMPILSTAETDKELAALHSVLAGALMFAGHPSEVLDHAEQAIMIARNHDMPIVLSRALMYKSMRLSDLGHLTQALTVMQGAVDIAVESDLMRQELRARGNLAVQQGDWDLPGALEGAESVLTLSRAIGDRDSEGWSLVGLAETHLWYGNWTEAEQYARLALATIPADQGSNIVGTMGRLCLLRLSAMRGRVAEVPLQLRALAELTASDGVQDRAMLLLARATVSAAEGDHPAALEHAATAAELLHDTFGINTEYFRQGWPLALESAMTLSRLDRVEQLLSLVSTAAPDTVSPYLTAQLKRCAALLAVQTANTNHLDIENELQAAITIFTDRAYPYWEARTQLDLGGWLMTQGRTHDATRLIQDALTKFERLGAQPLVEDTRLLLAAATG